MSRPLCNACRARHVGVNYKRDGKIHYRSRCDSCIREKRGVRPAKPGWVASGYQKKLVCDKCGFKARWSDQIIVFYIDGNLTNTQQHNLRSICANCAIGVKKQDLPWVGELSPNPDF